MVTTLKKLVSAQMCNRRNEGVTLQILVWSWQGFSFMKSLFLDYKTMMVVILMETIITVLIMLLTMLVNTLMIKGKTGGNNCLNEIFLNRHIFRWWPNCAYCCRSWQWLTLSVSTFSILWHFFMVNFFSVLFAYVCIVCIRFYSELETQNVLIFIFLRQKTFIF